MLFPNTINFHSINEFFHHCFQTKNLRVIQKFHAHLLRTGLFFVSPNLQTRLIFTYTCLNKNNLRSLTKFLKCLNPRNPIPFNSIISHLSQNGSHSLALKILSFMHFNGVYVDSYALCSSLTSLSCVKNDCIICIGKMMHAYVHKSGWLSSVFVGSALVDLYAKLCVNDAAMMFDEIPSKNIVCVNALLSGYAEAKMWDEVIQLVSRTPGSYFDVDNFTLTAALRACAGLCEVELGRQIHATVLRKFDLGADVFLQSLLIEMYGKCGLVERARQVFDMVGFRVNGERKRDVVLWTSMLGIYGRNGNYVEVIRLFGNMLKEGIRPDGVAFLTVIAACSHTGQVEVGIEYFKSMSLYGLFPSSEHYSCLVDLLCRAGELEKAWELIAEMPHSEDGNCFISMWGTLLSACNEHGNVDLGKLAAQQALELEPQNVGIYVLLSNMFARNGMWDEIGQLRELMKLRGLKKDIGWSSIGVAN